MLKKVWLVVFLVFIATIGMLIVVNKNRLTTDDRKDKAPANISFPATSNIGKFVYSPDVFYFDGSPDQVEYKYKGNIEFTYPSHYSLTTIGCRSYYSLVEKKTYCVNIGGITLGKINMEFFDLNNSYQKEEFELKTSNHNVLKRENLSDIKYKTVKYFTKADTNPNPGYDTDALVYNTDTGPVGIRFTVWYSNKLSDDELSQVEKDIKQILDSTVTK